MKQSTPFELMPGETLLLKTRPHLFAMLDLMAFWLGIVLLGVLYVLYYDPLTHLIESHLRAEFLVKYAYHIIWFVSILIPLVIIAFYRINFGYVLVLILLLAGNVILQWKIAPQLSLPAGEHAHLENYLLISVGILGLIGCEIFRRGHRYYLTTQRIVARFGVIKTTERSTLYSKIDDLVLQKSVLGSLLNFGTVIPLTATGLGMGQDFAIAGVNVGSGKGGLSAGIFAGGGKAKNVPRDLSFYVLYRIKKPGKARNLILREMQARERPRRKQE